MSSVTQVLVKSFKDYYLTERNNWHFNLIHTPEALETTEGITFLSGDRKILPNSIIKYLYSSYRVVILIDLPESIFSYHSASNSIIAEKILPTAKDLLENLLVFSENNQVEIEVSIVLVRAVTEPIRCIVHSYPLQTWLEVEDLEEMIKTAITCTELELLNYTQQNRKNSFNVDFVTLLKWSFFSLNLMNTEGLPVVIFISDAVNCNLNPGIYDGLTMEYCRADISFNVINLTEGLDSFSFEFGCLPESSSLKFLCKITGGYYSGAFVDDVLPLMLERRTEINKPENLVEIEQRQDLHKFVEETYCIEIPIKVMIDCRLREGFKFYEANEEKVILILDFHYNCFIEYSICKSDIEVAVICRKSLYKKIKDKMVDWNVFGRDRKPSLAERVSWLLQNMKETEKTALVIHQGITKERSMENMIEALENIPMSKWHRWFGVYRMEIVTTTEHHKPLIEASKRDFIDRLETISKNSYFANDFYLQKLKEGLLIGRLVWESENKLTFYLGVFNISSNTRIEYIENLTHLFLQIPTLQINKRPLATLLVQKMQNKNFSLSNVYSLFSYKPIIKVRKSFLFSYRKKRELLSSASAKMMLNILYSIKLNQGFYFIGDCEKTKNLLIKTVNVEGEIRNAEFYLQYLLYIKGNTVFSEIFIEPDSAGIQRMTETEIVAQIKEEYEQTDAAIYESFACFDYFMYKTLEGKLQDEDLGEAEDNLDETEIEIAEEDSLYCYFYNEIHEDLGSYEKIKLDIYEKMYDVYKNYEKPTFEPKVESFLENSNRIEIPLNIEPLYNEFWEKWTQSLGLLYSNLHTGLFKFSDCYLIQEKEHFFTRYISAELLLVIVLPTCSEFVSICQHRKTRYNLIVYEGSYHKLNVFETKKYYTLSPYVIHTLKKTHELLNKLYNRVLNSTCYHELLHKNLELENSYLSAIIYSCKELSESIQFHNLHKLMKETQFEHSDLLKSLVKESVILCGEIFEEIDTKFFELIKGYFDELHTGFWMIKNSEMQMFLTIGKNLSRLTDCIFCDSIELKAYISNEVAFFTHGWGRIIPPSANNTQFQEETNLLKLLTQEISDLLSELTVQFIRYCLPLNQSSLEVMLTYLPKIKGTRHIEYELDLIVPEKPYHECIHSEFLKQKLLNLRWINDKYFAVSTADFKSFYLKEELKVELCLIQSTSEEYHIPFWVVIQIKDEKFIEIDYLLPKSLEHAVLNENLIEKKLNEFCELIEIKINEKMLLNELLETGNISSMLIPIDKTIKSGPNKRKKFLDRYNRLSKPQDNESAATELESPYTLKVQYTKDFPISNRIPMNEANYSLINKFSNPPFLVYNRENLFILHTKTDIFIFRFNEIKSSNSIQKIESPMLRSKDLNSNRWVRFEILGIDRPQQETLNSIEKTIEENLQQSSLIKLADFLVKNKKTQIEKSDIEFIESLNEPLFIYYQIRELVSDTGLLLLYLHENLTRFLMPYERDEQILVLIYNFMQIIDAPNARQTSYLPLRQTENSTMQLGSTFGQAIALLYIKICYFTGDEIEYGRRKQRKYSIDELDEDSSWLLKSLKSPFAIRKVDGINYPSLPGHYLEVKLCENGDLNNSVFEQHIEICINQCISEYFLELLFEKVYYSKKTLRKAYYLIAEYSKILINTSLDYSVHPIPHDSPPFSMFSFFSACVGIVNRTLGETSVENLFNIQEDSNSLLISEHLSDLENYWNENYSNEKGVGRKIILSGIWGPKFIAYYLNKPFMHIPDSIKLYPNNVQDTYIERSIYIYLEIHPHTIEVYTYNLNKFLVNRLNSEFESHIQWTRERYKLLNNALIQKLGLHTHFLDTHSKQTIQKTGSLESLFTLYFAKGCTKIEMKENPVSFNINSLLNPEETEHFPLEEEENWKSFRMKGLMPQVNNGIKLKSKEDKVEHHGRLVNSMEKLKQNLWDQWWSIAFAYKKWCPQTKATLSKSVHKILKSHSNRIVNETILIRNLINKSQLIFYDRAVFHVKRVDTLPPGFDPLEEKKKMNKFLTEIKTTYAEELKKKFKMTVLRSEDHKFSIRNLSHERSVDSVKPLRKGWSSGILHKEREGSFQTYMRKVFEQSMFLIDVSFRESHLNVLVYTYENIQNHLKNNRQQDTVTTESTRKEIYGFLNHIKTSIWLFDTEIKHLAFLLCKPEDYPCIELSSTILEVLSTFSKPMFQCENSINEGRLVIDLGDLAGIRVEEIYKYFALNCEEYSFRSYKGQLSCDIVYTVSVPDEVSNSNTNPQKSKTLNPSELEALSDEVSLQEILSLRAVVYTMVPLKAHGRIPQPVLLEGVETPNKLRIRYFVIEYEKQKNQKNLERLKTFKENAEKKFIEAIKKTIGHNERDRLWEKLWDHTISDFPFEEFNELLESSDVKRMDEIDERIGELTSLEQIFNTKCFEFLASEYRNTKKLKQKSNHFIVFFTPKIFAYLVLDDGLRIYRVKRSAEILLREEDEFITDLVNKLLIWLYRKITNNE